ncbi:cupin domain-containing protein [Rhodococcus koreensis]
MTTSPVQSMPFNPEFTDTHGPIVIDRRSRASALTELAVGFAEFAVTGAIEPSALPYEEVLYVLEGELTLTQGEEKLVCTTGELITLEAGAVVTVAGTAGTRLLYSLTPAGLVETNHEPR